MADENRLEIVTHFVGLSGLGSWASVEPPRRLERAAMAASAAFFWEAEFWANPAAHHHAC